MSHIAVWTDDDGEVRRKHYRPDEVDTFDADHEVEDDGEHPATEPWERSREFFDEENGFHYKVDDATNGLDKNEANEMKSAFNSSKPERARELKQKGLENSN